MPRKDVNLFLGPDKAREIQRMLDWFKRFPGKAGPADGYRSKPPTSSGIPIPKIGKAVGNIAPRTFGDVTIWSGSPGSETELTFLTSPVQEFNLLDRTITAGKWCYMFGQYIFGATFPAMEVDCTLTAVLAPGGSANATVDYYQNGDNPGSTITLYSSRQQGSDTIANGTSVYATWDDVRQRYIARLWSC